jgi:hypothetical protein
LGVIISHGELHCDIRGLQVANTGSDGRAIDTGSASDFGVFENLILEGTYIGTSGNAGVITLREDTTIRNSVIIQRASGADHIVAIGTKTTALYNCTIVAADDLATAPTKIFLTGATGTCTVQNCGVFAGDSTKAIFTGAVTPTFTTCYSDISGTAGVTQATYSSEFQNVNDATRDFRLVTGAAMKDTGTTDATNAAIDIAGTARPSGAAYDVGCWEFVQGGAPPAAPTLRITQSGLIW